jgi:hypothetical protein
MQEDKLFRILDQNYSHFKLHYASCYTNKGFQLNFITEKECQPCVWMICQGIDNFGCILYKFEMGQDLSHYLKFQEKQFLWCRQLRNHLWILIVFLVGHP